MKAGCLDLEAEANCGLLLCALVGHTHQPWILDAY